MPLYYLNDPSGNYTLSGQGRDYPDLETALAAANRTARSLIEGKISGVAFDPRGRLDVQDERRRPVARILFAELTDILPG